MNYTAQIDDIVLFMPPSDTWLESRDVIQVITWPLFMMGVLFKFIEVMEDFV